MALGHLNDFMKFDWEKFFAKKAAEVTSIRSWDEYKDGEKTGNSLGTNITCVILHDSTDYVLKDQESFTNKLREISFKIRVPFKDCSLKIGDKVCGTAFKDQADFYLPVVEECKPYGSNGYLNNLKIVVSKFEYIKKK